MKKLLAAVVCSLSLVACGNSDTTAKDAAKCSATTNASLKGTKAAGATCTDVSECKPVDCSDNTCRAGCLSGKCANATDACK